MTDRLRFSFSFCGESVLFAYIYICSIYYANYCDAQCKCKTIGDWFINLILSYAIFYFVYGVHCNIYICYFYLGGRRGRGRDRMVVGFISTYVISAYHH
jgi:hypothetical protein